MKTWKPNVVFGLCAAAALGAALGCSGTADRPAVAPPANPDGTAPAGKPTEAAKPAPPLTLKWMVSEHPSQPIVVDAPAIREIKKRTNVDIQLEAVPGANYEEKKNALIATNNIPDVIKVSDKNIQEFARTGMFVEISPYLDQAPNFKALIETRPEMKKFLVDGKMYGFPVLEKYRVAVAPQLMIREDLLKQLNLQMPTSWEEFYRVLQAFKQAYPDLIPFSGRNGTKNMLGQLAYPLGSGGFPGFSTSGIYFEPRTGKYVFGPSSPEYKEVLVFLNKLYREKLLDPDYATNTPQMWTEKMSSGRALSYYDNNTIGARSFNNVLKQKDSAALLNLVPPMKNARGETRSYRYEKDWMRDIYAISSKVKDPLAVVKFFDWMYSEEGTLVTNFGIQGESFDIVNGVPKIKDSILEQHKSKQDIYTSVQSALGVGLLGFAVHVDESTLAQISDPLILQMAESIDSHTGKGIDYILSNPPFSKEEADKLKRIETQVNTMFLQEVDKFIMGTRSLDEYDSFRNQLNEQGALELEQIYNAALSRVQ